MVFCNTDECVVITNLDKRHNPYFNRWFSAIAERTELNNIRKGHNPYFNRWFSAIWYTKK